MDIFVLKRTAPQAFDGAENSRPLRLRQDNQGSSSRPPTPDVSRTPTPNVSRPPTPPIPADINIDELPYDLADRKIDWQLREFDDRFNEVNSALLIHMASFSPKKSFAAFNSERFIKTDGSWS